MAQDPLVIIVEDHVAYARLLRRALLRLLPACRFELFEDGLTAMRRLVDADRELPALLVLDLYLPGRTGHELLRDRAADARLTAVPVAIVTSSRTDADRELSLAGGADLHLTKPVDWPGFTALAERLVGLLGAPR